MLARGNRGHAVKTLQLDAIRLGFGELLGKAGADGIFGEDTEKTIKALQKWLKIEVDGIAGPQTKSSISKSKNNAGLKGTRNFNIHEFYCKGSNTILSGGMDKNLILNLETLRYELGNKPISINSGYRTKSHNKRVGGASKSQHLYGKAADIKVKGVSASKVYNQASKVFATSGVGKYNTFTHVDTRSGRVRFTG
ncbi:D-Ala-D-Ala carboxypeptidase family metallohydrolase [Oceanobacillus kimchii]|uniref:D-Ala-D-Ala carboxypeptidase family metallohydrolase n=1 Tax=Oceanobacillus kimchii TaxID=746691 RepID=UPI003C751ED9